MSFTRDVKAVTGISCSWVIFSAILFVVAIGGCATVKRVDPGYAGVLIDFGRGTTSGQPAVTSIPTGKYKFIMPVYQRLVEYPIAQQTLSMVQRSEEGQVVGDDSVKCQDSNGIQLSIDSSTLWRVEPDHVGQLYLLRPNMDLVGHEGADIASTVVRRDVRNAITNSCAYFRYDEIFGPKRQDLALKVAELLKPNLQRTYIQLDNFLLGEIHLPPDQESAISEKARRQQEALAAGYAQQKAENEAKGVIAAADGARQAQILNAQGQAESIRVVNEQLAKSPEYVRYLAVTKWNGIMPTTLLNSGSGETPIFAAIQTGGGSAPPTEPEQ